jgi:eukaryotic-like serine/threonine-protein kinase
MCQNKELLVLDPGSPEYPVFFSHYLLTGFIGQGGMAEIYRAVNLNNNNILALKCMNRKLSSKQKYIDMFLDEGKLGKLLNHNNIAKINEVNSIDNIYFFTMEYVSGQDLTKIVKKLKLENQKLVIPSILYIILEVCKGLSYIHSLKDKNGKSYKIVNRDISPGNIRISYNGDVKILDFGIAAGKHIITSQPKDIKGKYNYMSPEQIQGLPVDFQTDIFSLGIVLYELLTLEMLFKDENENILIEKVKNSQITPPSSLNMDIPEKLDKIVLKALGREKKLRFQSIDLFRNELYKIFEPFDFNKNEFICFFQELFKKEYENEKWNLDLINSLTESRIDSD